MNSTRIAVLVLGVALLLIRSDAFSRIPSSIKLAKPRSQTTPINYKQGKPLSAMLPGDPLLVGTLTQGTINVISIYNNILIAR